jgi:hypothetical protein
MKQGRVFLVLLVLTLAAIGVPSYDERADAAHVETSDELIMRVCGGPVGTIGGEEALQEDE